MSFKIFLYDTDTDCIGSGTLSSSYVQWQLEAAGGRDVEVHISSAGGSAFDAIAIYDLLKKYSGKVTTYVDALAASAASIVAMGGNEVVMSKYALLMIHKPMVDTGGNSDELLKDIQMLNAVQSRLAQIYIDKTGLSPENINSLINSVTWLTADQALDLGFIDEVEDYAAQISNKTVISNYVRTAPVIYQKCINSSGEESILLDVDGVGNITLGNAMTSSSPAGIFVYEDSSNQLMKRSFANVFDDITGEVEETDLLPADHLITVTKDGVSYKLLAIAT